MKAMNTNRVSKIARCTSGAALAAMLVSGSALSLAGKPASGVESNSGSERFTLAYQCQGNTKSLYLASEAIPDGKRFYVQYVNGNLYNTTESIGHPVLFVDPSVSNQPLHINTIPYGEVGQQAMISEHVAVTFEVTPAYLTKNGNPTSNFGSGQLCQVTFHGVLEDI